MITIQKYFNSLLILIMFMYSLFTYAQQFTPFEKLKGEQTIKKGTWNSRQIEYYDRQVLIKLKVGVKVQDVMPLLSRYNAKLKRNFDKLGWGSIILPESSDMFQVISALKGNNFIEYIEPNMVAYIQSEPNDPYFLDGKQWALKNTGQSPPGGTSNADIDASEAWDISQGDPNIVIAILDTGIPMVDGVLSHPDLDDPIKFILGPDFCEPQIPEWAGVRDINGHGSHITGIASAETNNDTGISGVAGNCKVLIIQSQDFGGEGPYESFYDGVKYAVDYADSVGAKLVINYSVGGTSQSSILEAAIQYALNHNVLICAAGGNKNNDTLTYPAEYSISYNNLIAVGATDHYDMRASYSNHSPSLNVVAPGGYGSDVNGDDIYSTTPNYPFYKYGQTQGVITLNYSYMFGTSQATPLVSGIAALILSVNPNLTPFQIRNIIQQTAEDKGAPGRDDYYGYGRVNAYRALLLTQAFSNKATSQTATANNGQRKIVQDASGNYHIVFSSGGEIFYRKSLGGTTWQDPVMISHVKGSNDLPSVTTGPYNSVLITWQRTTGTSTYDIYLALSTNDGVDWNTSYKYALASSVSSGAAPAPVISCDQVIWRRSVVFGSNQGLRSYTTTTTYPLQSNWTSQQITTNANDQNPSLAYIAGAPYLISLNQNISDNHVYYRYQNSSGNWSSGVNLSSVVPGTAVNKNPSISGAPSYGYLYAAWARVKNSGSSSNDYSIIFRKNLLVDGAWPNEYYTTYYEGQQLPSITGLSSGYASHNVSLLFQTIPSIGNSVYKQTFNSINWSSPTLVASNSVYPSVSTGTANAKYVYTSGTSSPYTVTLGSETLSKENLNEGSYYRSVALMDSSGAYLEIQLNDISFKLKDGSVKKLDFIPVTLDTFSLNTGNCWTLLTTVNDFVPQDAKEISFDYALNMENADKLFVGNKGNGKIELSVLGTDKKVLLKKETNLDEIKEVKINLNKKDVLQLAQLTNKGEPIAVNLSLKGLVLKEGAYASLGHIYDYTSSKDSVNKELASKINDEVPAAFELKNYPNPFNPTTIIKYSIPEPMKVNLTVYDILGREIITLVNEDKPAGSYEVMFDASGLSSGVYLYKLTTPENILIGKMSVVK